jgi:hypothetical protein
LRSIKVKVKLSLYMPSMHEREEGVAVPILICGAGRSWVVSHPSTLRKETWYSLYLRSTPNIYMTSVGRK